MNNPPNCKLAVTCPQNPDNGTLVGNDRDAHGCIPSAGYSWCDAKQKCIRPWEENCSGTQMANPASVNCIDQGGALDIRDTPQGQIGVCLINGNECEEWALFRGEGCIAPEDATGGEQTGFIACPTEKPTGPIACTLEWMPVCGKIILNMGDTVYQTFGNKCGACAAMKVIGYTQGECPTPNYVECNHAIARGEMCMTNYNPVCAQKDNGIRCIRAPCPSTDNVTYSNGCEACKDEKVYGYVPGACANDTA
jgi:putative hemolysin